MLSLLSPDQAHYLQRRWARLVPTCRETRLPLLPPCATIQACLTCRRCPSHRADPQAAASWLHMQVLIRGFISANQRAAASAVGPDPGKQLADGSAAAGGGSIAGAALTQQVRPREL